MILTYKNKKSFQDIVKAIPNSGIKFSKNLPGGNKLVRGDNLEVMKAMVENNNLTNKVDLVYIDPPFATSGTFKIGEDRVSTISHSNEDKLAYEDLLVGEDFLEFLRERLILIREIMSNKASIYFHIDYKIGHYVKVLMDEIFGRENFINDITRIKCNPKNFQRKAFGNVKDLILFYSKTENYVWNNQTILLDKDDVEKRFNKISKDGRRYTTVPLHAPGETTNGKTGKEWRGIKPPKGRHWRCAPEVLDQLEKDSLIEWSSNGVPRKKIYADESNGKKMQDIWEFKDPQYPRYPTEKNLDMLKFIVKSSSNEGDLIMDCFCGSGTTLAAASELNRRWIGIDSSEEAIKVAKKRLSAVKPSLFSQDIKFESLEF